MAHIADERPGHAHHQAFHLQEVDLADAGGSVDQEDDVCCLSVITPAWVGLGLELVITPAWMVLGLGLGLVITPAWIGLGVVTQRLRNTTQDYTTLEGL